MSNFCPVTSDLDHYLDSIDDTEAQAEAQADPEMDSLAECLPWDAGMTLDDWEGLNDE